MKHYFSVSFQFQFLIWLGLILILKIHTMSEPPIWDTAMGVFPPAIYLYENGFDLWSLAQQSDWWLGGPNVNTFSVWTWFIALVMALTQSPELTFNILHLLTYFINALAISTLVWRIHAMGISPLLCLTTGLLLLTTPLVLVQVGYMYTESLVMCFAIFAFNSFEKRNHGLAAIYAIIAFSIKLTGLAIVVGIFVALALKLVKVFTFRDLLILASIPILSITILLLPFFFAAINQDHGLGWGGADVLYASLLDRSLKISDQLILPLISLVCCVAICYSKLKKAMASRRFDDLLNTEFSDSAFVITITSLVVFFLSLIVAPLFGYLFLPRYLVPMFPFAFLAICLAAQRYNYEKIGSTLFLFFCILNIFNYNGKFYKPTASFSIAERSHAYTNLSLGHKLTMKKIASLPEAKPIYVSREIHYFSSHPMMGYHLEKKQNIHNILNPSLLTTPIEEFPDDFFVVLSTSARIHGGKRLSAIVKEAIGNSEWKVRKIQNLKIENIKMRIYHITRVVS